jgi:hypothetical protein
VCVCYPKLYSASEIDHGAYEVDEQYFIKGCSRVVAYKVVVAYEVDEQYCSKGCSRVVHEMYPGGTSSLFIGGCSCVVREEYVIGGERCGCAFE